MVFRRTGLSRGLAGAAVVALGFAPGAPASIGYPAILSLGTSGSLVVLLTRLGDGHVVLPDDVIELRIGRGGGPGRARKPGALTREGSGRPAAGRDDQRRAASGTAAPIAAYPAALGCRWSPGS